jgi:hypothetical protein
MTLHLENDENIGFGRSFFHIVPTGK